MTDSTADPLAACIDAIRGVSKPPSAAIIVEDLCIGCALCIRSCPVDAIIGAAGQMHTVVAAWCTGCELCLPPCPVDCIRMSPLPEATRDLQATTELARRRYEIQLQRRGREQAERAWRHGAKAAAPQVAQTAQTRQSLIDAAIVRARKINARQRGQAR